MEQKNAPQTGTQEQSKKLLLTQTEAADRYGVSSRYIRILQKQGILPTVRLGRAVRVPVAQADRVINHLTTGGMA